MIALLLLTIAVGQTPGVLRGTFVQGEQWLKQPPLSGRDLTGFIVSAPHARINTRALDLYFSPRVASRRICVQFRSYDARYSALIAYVAPVSEGWYRLDFPTKYAKDLNQYTAEQLAVIAWPGDDCEVGLGSKPQVFALRWNGATGSGMALLVNARARAVVAELGREEPCVRVQASGSLTAYDSRCDVRMPSETIYVRLEGEQPGFITVHAIVPK
jgi:hypothetical protein